MRGVASPEQEEQEHSWKENATVTTPLGNISATFPAILSPTPQFSLGP